MCTSRPTALVATKHREAELRVADRFNHHPRRELALREQSTQRSSVLNAHRALRELGALSKLPRLLSALRVVDHRATNRGLARILGLRCANRGERADHRRSPQRPSQLRSNRHALHHERFVIVVL
jgi:hypothetical protein